MAGFGESLRSGLEGAVCSFLSAADNARGWLNKNSVIGISDGLFGPAIRATLCNTPPDPNYSDPPFQGGQCPVLYTIRQFAEYELYNCATNTLAATISQELPPIAGRPGPIKYLGATNVEYESCGEGKLSTQQFSVEDASGSVYSVGPISQNLVGRYVFSNSSRFEVVREDGQPDGCGDPPPGTNPPNTPDGGWRLPPITVEYDDGGGPTIAAALGVVIFAPIINVNGNLNFPIRIDGNDFNLELNGSINFEGGLNIDFGMRRPPGSDSEVDNPPPEVPPEIKPPVPPSDDTERRVIGVQVSLQAIADRVATVIFQDGGNPDVYAPDLGLVSFLISAGVEGTGWTTDLRVKNAQAYIPCPAPQGALAVRGTPREGVAWVLTPVYGGRDEAFTSPR